VNSQDQFYIDHKVPRCFVAGQRIPSDRETNISACSFSNTRNPSPYDGRPEPSSSPCCVSMTHTQSARARMDDVVSPRRSSLMDVGHACLCARTLRPYLSFSYLRNIIPIQVTRPPMSAQSARLEPCHSWSLKGMSWRIAFPPSQRDNLKAIVFMSSLSWLCVWSLTKKRIPCV
jgi:hypothetical protein